MCFYPELTWELTDDIVKLPIDFIDHLEYFGRWAPHHRLELAIQQVKTGTGGGSHGQHEETGAAEDERTGARGKSVGAKAESTGATDESVGATYDSASAPEGSCPNEEARHPRVPSARQGSCGEIAKGSFKGVQVGASEMVVPHSRQ